MKKRKVTFYDIIFQGCDSINETKIYLSNLLTFIQGLTPCDRKVDLHSERFCFMDNLQTDDSGEYYRILFKSARHSYRAPLLDRVTINERENPKLMTEGEQMKTHAIIKVLPGKITLILEQGANCMTSSNIAYYLNQFVPQYNEEHPEQAIYGMFIAQQILKNDFWEQLQSMSRVKKAIVVTDKRVLGSESLNYSQRMYSIKDTINIDIVAKRKESLKDTVTDIWNSRIAGRSEITSIRVEGLGEHNEQTIINTEQFAKVEYVEANQNEDTGEFNTLDLFNRMMLVAQRYHV